MAMSTDRGDAATRRYREASAALEERPSAETRAAILAAAARHVEAKPRAADAPRAAHRRRWPLAAAAAVLLSTLAVMMAQRTEEEMPTFSAPAERSQDRDRVAAAPAQATLPSPPAAGESPASPPASRAAPAASRPEPEAKNDVPGGPRAGALGPEARPKKSAPAGTTDEQAIASSGVPEVRDHGSTIAANAAKPQAQAAREQEVASAEARRAFPAAPPAASPPIAATPAPAELGASRGASDAAQADAARASRAARKEAAPAPAAAPAAAGAIREEAQRDFERSAQDWLARITRLRGEGRHADADAELKRFRERYPDVQVPPAALPPAAPPTGTR
jgi:hypothetical protein